ncbi:hypothetical protein [Actinoplanes sichuanensis]
MIPFSDPDTHLQMARFRIDGMLRDACEHRHARRRRLLRFRRRALTS